MLVLHLHYFNMRLFLANHRRIHGSPILEQSNVFEKDRRYKRVASPQVPAKTAFCELTPVKSGLRRVADQVRLSEHRVFNGPDTDINLHVFSSGCPEIDRMLMFRHWLRANAADRDLYTRSKLVLAQKE